MIDSSRSHRVRALVASALLVAAMASCRTTTILTPQVTLPAGERDEARVAEAIHSAGLRYGWEMVKDGPGHITGTLRLRKHVAVVSIPYDANSYRIEYEDSTLLRHKGNVIHRNYNRWVNNLSEEIKAQLGYGG